MRINTVNEFKEQRRRRIFVDRMHDKLREKEDRVRSHGMRNDRRHSYNLL